MVGFHSNRGCMVSNNKKLYKIANALENWAHYFPVDILDSLNFFVNISFV